MTEKNEEGKGTINLSFAPKDVGIAVVGAYLAVTNTLSIGTASDVKKVVDHDAQVITKSVTENVDSVISNVNIIKSQNDMIMDHINTESETHRDYVNLQKKFSKLKNKCKKQELGDDSLVEEESVKAWLIKKLLTNNEFQDN